MKNLFYLVAIICIAAVCITSCTSTSVEEEMEEIKEYKLKDEKQNTYSKRAPSSDKDEEPEN